MKTFQLVILVLITNGCLAAIHNVPSDFWTIHEALNFYAAGDTILLDRGTYYERLEIPDRDLTIASNYIFTHDTIDKLRTVLDGEYGGTVVSISPGNLRTLKMLGFTITHGEGYRQEYGRYIGGGFDARDSINVVMEDMVFVDNHALTRGSAINMSENLMTGYIGDITLKRIDICDNSINSTGGWNTRIVSSGNAYLEDIHFNALPTSGRIMVLIADSVFAKNIELSGLEYSAEYPVSIMGNYHLQMRDVFVHDNRPIQHELLNLISSYGILDVRNLWITDNICEIPCSGSSGEPVNISALYVYADSIFIYRNHAWAHTCGASIGAYEAGEIHHVDARLNISGEVFSGYGCSRGVLGTQNCSIYDSQFSDNQVILIQNPDNPDLGAIGANVLNVSSFAGDTVRVENCEFVNNYVDDQDDYTNSATNPQPNLARVLYGTGQNSHLHFENLLFQDNRQPNIAPDKPHDFAGSGGISCVFVINGADNVSVSAKDIYIHDNDDGGINFYNCADVSLNNVEVVNTPRLGIFIYPEHPCTVQVDNIFIKGVITQDMFHPWPYNWSYHGGLTLVSRISAIGSNITITDCDLPYILATSSSADPEPQKLSNCIITGNSFVDFQKYNVNSNPIEFHYSYIQEEVFGSGNIIGNDPLFDPDLGAPFLASNSPCIDAGDPDVEYNDLVDPMGPGTALWPSQGELRNDVGYTGGPGALAFNYTGVVTQPNSTARPQSAHLGNAYPNPFNPVTQIPYYLPKASNVVIDVFDILGRRVSILEQGLQAAGEHRELFDGSALASGMYFVKLQAAGEQVEVQKVMLIK